MNMTPTLNVKIKEEINKLAFLQTKATEISELQFGYRTNKCNKSISKDKNLILLIELVNKLYKISEELVLFQETNINSKNSNRWNAINKKINLLLYRNIKKIVKNKIYNKEIELPPNKIIEMKNVTKYYSTQSINTKVLSDVSLSIDEGDFVVILGPSGSGKTSLMNILSGIDQPTHGSLNVGGFNLQKLSNSKLTNFRQEIISYVFQRYGLLPNLTVYENVAMGSFLGHDLEKSKSKILSSRITADDEKKILNIIEWVDMLESKDKYPYELSGGQKQRTSIARTIAKVPKIIFGDEPTAAVDEQMSLSIIDLFCKINREYKTTIIIITHDTKIASYANKVIYVKDGYIENIKINKKRINNENNKD